MPVFSRVFDSTSATAFETLASGDYLSIGADASLAIDGSSAHAIAASESASIFNSGQVIGGGSAINASGGSMTLFNEGGLFGGGSFAAVTFGNEGNSVFNTGVISGSSAGGDGLLLQDGVSNATNFIENYGTIRGIGDDAIQINAGALDSSMIRNFGILEVLGQSGSALNLDGGEDTVFNTGIIRMNSADRTAVVLGGGDDTLDNSLGTIIGRISGGSGADNFIGGKSSEYFDGGSGIDTMAGGGGNDRYVVDDAADVVTEGAGGGTDTVLASVAYTLAAGTAIEVLQTTDDAGVTNLNLTGNELAQAIRGNAGSNILVAGSGKDALFGLDGADTLLGGLGNDQLTGGLGNDNFFFDTALSAKKNVDVITDFSHADDTIQLDDAIFSGLATGALKAAAFRAGTSALDASDRIIYDKASGNVFYDADGTGAKAQVLFATLTGSPDDVTRYDFFIM